MTPDAAVEPNESVILTLTGASGDGVINPAASQRERRDHQRRPRRHPGTEGRIVVDATHTVKSKPFPYGGCDKIVGRSGSAPPLRPWRRRTSFWGSARTFFAATMAMTGSTAAAANSKLFGAAGDDTFVFDAKIGNGGTRSYAGDRRLCGATF